MVCHALWLRLAAVTCFFPASGWAADAWAKLKPGMTRVETVTMLGNEVLGSRGRGFELAIYENRAEVLFLHGGVVAWTPPSTSTSAPSPKDGFKFDQQWKPRFRVPPLIEAKPEPAKRSQFLPAYYRQ